MSDKSVHDNEHLFQRVREILDNARHKVYRTANIEMLRAYWTVGKEIVEEEQKGLDRAKYGRGLIKDLSITLYRRWERFYRNQPQVYEAVLPNL